MSTVPENLHYTKDHEWVRLEGGHAYIGITDHAQQSLGDITFVELPEVDAAFSTGDTFGVVESVKAASDLYMPVSGQVLEINDVLDASPEKVNEDPYGEGWLIKVKLDDPSATDGLLASAEYADII